MGQQRTDTPAQRDAKQRVADRRRCRNCNRRSALGSRQEIVGEYGRRRGHVRRCLYCGHEVGILDGQPFSGQLADVDAEYAES